MKHLIIAAALVAGLAVAGCGKVDEHENDTQVVEHIGDCKVYRIHAPQTYSNYVWTTVCPDGHASTQTTDGHSGKGAHYEDVVIDTVRTGGE